MKEINKDSEMDVANRVSRGGRTVRVWYTPHYVSEAATRLIWKASLKLVLHRSGVSHLAAV
jgi:hypothetical protein